MNRRELHIAGALACAFGTWWFLQRLHPKPAWVRVAAAIPSIW